MSAMRLPAALLLGLSLFAAAAAAQTPTPIVLMISIDGLRPDYVTAADKHGLKIPALRRFVAEGVFAEGVLGVIPTVTYPSHTTLITGVWPAKHGILANTIFDPQRTGQTAWYWYTEDIRSPTLWDAAAAAGWTTASIQWPVSVGARVTWNIPEYWRANTSEDAKLLRALSTPGLLAELEAELGPWARALEADDDEARGRFAVRVLEKKRPALLTLHLLALDHTQHETRPFSAETFAVLERLDAVVGKLRETVERLAPNRAFVAIVSDHGFAGVDTVLNLFVAFRDAGLLTIERGRISDWKAIPWTSGGSAAIMLKDANDGVTRGQVRALLDKLAADGANGIDRVLDADALRARGGFPPAAFVVGLKPGWQMSSSLSGSVLSPGKGGNHGHLPDVPDLRAAFFMIGPGVPAGRALGLIDMRDIAPTLAKRVGLSLPTADGKNLLP
jgi:predicted AlkP superfamily pyrophosphatase or phosphodiesterase